MIHYRRPTQLALRAALLLALRPSGSAFRVRELAKAMNAPATYLAKVLQTLIHAGLVQSVRGPGGGVRLARPAQDIHLWDILSVMEPVEEYEGCILGLEHCNDLTPCPLHQQWCSIRQQLIESLQSVHLEQFAQAAVKKGLPGTYSMGGSVATSFGSSGVQP